MKTYLKYILSILLTVILICGGILVYSVITPVEDTDAPEKTNAVTKAVSADRFAFADRFDLLPDNVSGARVNVDEYGDPESAAALLASLGEVNVNTVLAYSESGEGSFDAVTEAAAGRGAKVFFLVDSGNISPELPGKIQKASPAGIAIAGFTEEAYHEMLACSCGAPVGAYVTSAADIPESAEFAFGEINGDFASGSAARITDEYTAFVRAGGCPVYAVFRCDLYFTPEDGYTDDIWEQIRLVYNSSLMSGGIMYSPDEIAGNYGGEATAISGYYGNFNISSFTALEITGFDLSADHADLLLACRGEEGFPVSVISTAGGVAEQTPGKDGAASFTIPLRIGRNRITVRHKNALKTYYIDRVTDVLTAQGAANAGGQRTLLTATALTGSEVAARCGDMTVPLSVCGRADGEHMYYSAYTDLPAGADFVFTAVKNGIRDTGNGSPNGAAGTASPYDDHGAGRTGLMCSVNTGHAEAAVSGSDSDASDPLCTPQARGAYGNVSGIQISSGKPMYMISSGMQIYASDCTLIVDAFAADPGNTLSFTLDSDGRDSEVKIAAAIPTFTKVTVGPQEYFTDKFGRDRAVKSFAPEYLDVGFYDTYNYTGMTYSETGATGIISSAEWLESDQSGLAVLRLRLNPDEKFAGYSLTLDSESSVYSLKVFRAPPALAGAVVMIDPGHGGYSSTGAAYKNQVSEKDVTLAIGLKLKAILESRGAEVIMTRSADEEISLERRAELERTFAPDAFVSIHCDGSDYATVRGTATYYYRNHSYPLADAVNSSLSALYANTFYPGSYTANGATYFPFLVTRVEECPSVLIETGYITNEGDKNILTSADGQDKIAAATADGIEEYFRR